MKNNFSFLGFLNHASVFIAAAIPLFFLFWTLVALLFKLLGFSSPVEIQIVLSIIATLAVSFFISSSSHNRWWLLGAWILFLINHTIPSI